MLSTMRHAWDAACNFCSSCPDNYRVSHAQLYREAYQLLRQCGSVYVLRKTRISPIPNIEFGELAAASILCINHKGSSPIMASPPFEGFVFIQAIGEDRGLIDGKRIDRVPVTTFNFFYEPGSRQTKLDARVSAEPLQLHR